MIYINFLSFHYAYTRQKRNITRLILFLFVCLLHSARPSLRLLHTVSLPVWPSKHLAQKFVHFRAEKWRVSHHGSSYLQGWKIETIKGQIDAQTFAFKASVSQAKMYLYFQSVSNCTVCSFQVPPPTHKYLYWINAINAQMSIKRTNKQTKSRLRIILINDSPLQHVYRAQLL